MAAAIGLLRQAGADPIEAAFLIELGFLGGRQKLDLPSTALVCYP